MTQHIMATGNYMFFFYNMLKRHLDKAISHTRKLLSKEVRIIIEILTIEIFDPKLIINSTECIKQCYYLATIF